MTTCWATLKVDGTFERHEGVPTLTDLQAAVGGLIERVEIGHGIDLWVNEEGKFEDSGENRVATLFAKPGTHIFTGDYIAGDVAFTGGCDDEGETLGLNDEQFAYIAQAERIVEIVPGSNVWNVTGVNL
jgi:hypothetical protein